MSAADASAVADEIEGLREKHRRFVERYCVHFNATQAAKEVGYSARSAHAQGHRLLKRDDIRRAIDVRMDELGMSAAEATYRLSRQAAGTVGHFLEKGQASITGRDAKAHLDLVKEIEFETDAKGRRVVKKLKLHDSQSALDKVAKIRGLYEGEDTLIGKLLIVRDPDEVLAELRGARSEPAP